MLSAQETNGGLWGAGLETGGPALGGPQGAPWKEGLAGLEEEGRGRLWEEGQQSKGWEAERCWQTQ